MGRQNIQKERRNQILEAFYTLAKERGLSGTDVRSIAAHADIKLSLLYYYFADKDEMIGQLAPFVAHKYATSFAGMLEQVSEKEQVLETASLYMFNEEIITNDSGLFYDLWGAAKRNPKIEKGFRQLYRQFRDTIADMLRRAGLPEETSEKDLKAFSALVVSMFIGIYIQADFDRKTIDIDNVRQQFLQLTRKFTGLDE